MKNVHTIHCDNSRQESFKFESREMNLQSSFREGQSFYLPKTASQDQMLLNVKPLIAIPSFPKFPWDQTNNIAFNRDLVNTTITSDIYTNHQEQKHVNNHYRYKNINAEYAKELSKCEGENISAEGTKNLLDNSKKISKNIFSQQQNKQNIKEIDPCHDMILKKSNKKFLSKQRSKRNPWKPSEDLRLLELIGVYGECWAMISSKMPDRTGKQIRDRFLNILRPNLKKGDWSPTEDNLLVMLYYQLGHKWSLIAKHLPGRSEAQVKNRFYSHVKKGLDSTDPAKINPSTFEDRTFKDIEILKADRKKNSEFQREENSENEYFLSKVEPIEIKVESFEPKVEVLSSKIKTEEDSLNTIYQVPIQTNHCFSLYNQVNKKRVPQDYMNIFQMQGLEESQKNQKPTMHVERFSSENENIFQRSRNLQNIGHHVHLSEKRPNSIKDKEVDMVLEILANYYEKCEEKEAIELKSERYCQLDTRRAKLEFLLSRTTEEMNNITTSMSEK